MYRTFESCRPSLIFFIRLRASASGQMPCSSILLTNWFAAAYVTPVRSCASLCVMKSHPRIFEAALNITTDPFYIAGSL